MKSESHGPPDNLPEFTYRGARTLILLHEQHLRSFLVTWQIAKGAGVLLPVTHDPDYASFAKLLVHVLSCARRYMVWICQNLQLPDPQIQSEPGVEEVENSAAGYLDHLIQQWRRPLTGLSEELFFKPVYRSWWDVDYCVEAMLEHAAMHPLRHQLQLRELIAGINHD